MRRVILTAIGVAVVLVLACPAGAANPMQTLKRQVAALKQRVSALEAVVSCLDAVRPVARFGVGDEGYVYAFGEQYVVTTGLDGVNDVSGVEHVVYLAEVNARCVQGEVQRRGAPLPVRQWGAAASNEAKIRSFRLARLERW